MYAMYIQNQVVSTPMTVVPSPEMVNSGYSHEMVNSGYSNKMVSSGYLHFNPMQQVDASSDPLSCFNVSYLKYSFHYALSFNLTLV